MLCIVMHYSTKEEVRVHFSTKYEAFRGRWVKKKREERKSEKNPACKSKAF